MKNSRFILKTILTTVLLSSALGIYLPHDTTVEAVKVMPSTAVTSDYETFLTPIWQVKTDGYGLYDSQAPISNGLIYYSSGGTLTATDISTGKAKWTYRNASHPEIVTNNSVFFINSNGYLVKVHAKTGKLIWKVKVASAPIEIGAHAKLVNGWIYLANESGGIAAYNPISGLKEWENKGIPMYAGSIYTEYDGILVVSSTVNNISSQFFGLDPATGKKLWRIEGKYSFIAYREGNLILRQMSDAAYNSPNTPIPGYMMTITNVDITTGKVTKKENYNPLEDISRLGNSFTSLQGSYIYTVDGNMDVNEHFLNRFKMGPASESNMKSYEEFGDWLAGPTSGTTFFQKDGQLIRVNVNDGRIDTYGEITSPVLYLQKIGKVVFVGFENGYFHIMNATTGKTLAKVKTGAKQFGKTFVDHGHVFIQTEDELIVVNLPDELK